MVKLRTAFVGAVVVASAAVLAASGVASAGSTPACAGGKM
jgi:hypothetical protein